DDRMLLPIDVDRAAGSRQRRNLRATRRPHVELKSASRSRMRPCPAPGSIMAGGRSRADAIHLRYSVVPQTTCVRARPATCHDPSRSGRRPLPQRPTARTPDELAATTTKEELTKRPPKTVIDGPDGGHQRVRDRAFSILSS